MKTKKNNNAGKSCATIGCAFVVGERSITGLCKRCYSSIYSWTKRDKQSVISRVKTLHLYESRMNLLLTPTNVKIVRPKQIYSKYVVLPGSVSTYRKRTKYKIVKGERPKRKVSAT